MGNCMSNNIGNYSYQHTTECCEKCVVKNARATPRIDCINVKKNDNSSYVFCKCENNHLFYAEVSERYYKKYIAKNDAVSRFEFEKLEMKFFMLKLRMREYENKMQSIEREQREQGAQIGTSAPSVPSAYCVPYAPSAPFAN